MRPDRLRTIGVAALLAAATAGGATLWGQKLQPSEPYPLRDQPVTLTLSDNAGAPVAGAVVSVTYRPNSQTVHSETLTPTDAAGEVRWTPTDAGIVTLAATRPGEEAPLATANVAVRFGGFPPIGLTIMVIAALLLFGGVAFGFRLLLSGDRQPLPEPPST